ncbi:ShKT domain-containing protein [Strongyloides ratti]|uniref:ShKT domain-containing protein n=1 Tax=Strongyloides ratti TaxID=34506 RepID=A0A090LPB9_STRRB|nr:ShKT domain-containing protein [Strongyloides ratti]CEF70039.1 ShKT domain-containing protein [Strongyloides ratti]
MKYYCIILFFTILTVLHGCNDVDPDCKDKLKYCNDSNYQPLMKKYCALTCNLCPVITTPSPYGVCVMNECPVGAQCIQNLCIPDTQLTTPSSNCVDYASNCETIKTYCEVPSYIPLMKANCAKTCGYCGSSMATTVKTTTQPSSGPCISGICPAGNTCINSLCYPIPNSKSTPSTCIDYATNCQSLKDYCRNSVYHDIMKEQCAKTCDYCS